MTFSIRYMDKVGNQTNKNEGIRREIIVPIHVAQWVLDAKEGDIIIIEKKRDVNEK